MKFKPLYFILFLTIVIYAIHMLGYVTAYSHQDRSAKSFGSFAITTAKGDQGYAIDLTFYMRQIRNTYQNGPSLFVEDLLYEYEDKSFAIGNLVPVLAGIPLLFSDNIDSAILLSPLLSIFLSIMLLWLIMGNTIGLDVLKKHWLSFFLLVSVCLLTSSSTFFNLINLKKIFLSVDFLPRDLDYIGRFPYTEFSIFLLLFWFYTLTRFIKSNTVKNGILLGVSLCILQYSYFYYWPAAAFFTSILLCLNFIDFKSLSRNFMVVFVTYGVLTSPYWVKFFAFQNSEFIDEFLTRMGKVDGIYIYLSASLQIIGLSILFYIYDFYAEFKNQRNSNGVTGVFFSSIRASKYQLALAFTTLVLLNLSMVVGYSVEAYHWLLTFYYPLITIISIQYLITIIENFADRSSKRILQLIRIGVASFIILIVTAATANNFVFGKGSAPFFMLTKSETELISYIDNFLPKRTIVVTNNFALSDMVNARTNTRLFVPTYGITYATNLENIERLVIGFSMMGYSKSALKAEMRKGEKWTKYLLQVMALEYELPKNYTATIPDNYCAIVSFGTNTYLVNGEYTYTAELDQLIDVTYDALKGSSELYKLDYMIIYKNFLPEDLNTNEKYIILFENQDFKIIKAT